MKFATRIISGYATILRSAARYIGAVAGIVLTTALVVIPLWALAQHYPALYSTLAIGACALWIVLWIFIKLRNKIRHEGAGRIIRGVVLRIAAGSLVAIELAGVFTGWGIEGWLVRGFSALLLLITIGLMLHRHYNNQR